jgi:hypothetical protein
VGRRDGRAVVTGLGRRVAAAVLVVALTSMAAGMASGQGRTDSLRRPLHLPRLGPGKRCPVSPSRASPWASQILNGRRLAYLVGVGGATRGTIAIDFSVANGLGWYGQKTPWAVNRSYGGPVLIRGGRIDHAGKVRFTKAHGQHLRKLFWRRGADQGSPPNRAFRFLAAETLVRAPGCYALQVDGTSFSRIVVVRVPR